MSMKRQLNIISGTNGKLRRLKLSKNVQLVFRTAAFVILVPSISIIIFVFITVFLFVFACLARPHN